MNRKGTTWTAGIGLAVLALAACSSTQFTSTWKNPRARPIDLAGQPIAAVVMLKGEGPRRAAEDRLANEITRLGGRGVPAYTIVGGADGRNRERARAAFEAAGIQGVVSVRLVDKSRQVTYVPGMSYRPGRWRHPYYRSYWNYYGYGWGYLDDPGYNRVDTVLSVETTVYSLVQDKMIWGGLSKTVNPGNAEELVGEIAVQAAAEMKEAGMLR
jgi:hypothetical protein